VTPDAGTLALEGAPLPVGHPLAARRAGVSIVYQELTLVPELPAAENIFLGREEASPFLRRDAMTQIAQAQLNALGAQVSAGAHNGLNLFHVEPYDQLIAKGLVLLAAASLDRWRLQAA
jgi:ABC-type sugar transport system ATPase subunit